VVSNTLTSADWNNSHIIRGDAVAEITRLKQEAGENLVVHGSGKLVQTLLRNHLVDRIRLLVYPVVLGNGQRLFEDGTTANLKLLESRPMSTGVVGLIYEVMQS